jgi:hypothetical protein
MGLTPEAFEEIKRKKLADQREQRQEQELDKQEIKELTKEVQQSNYPKTWESKSLKEKIKGYFVRTPEEDAQHLREQRAYAETFYKAKEAAMRKRGVKEGWNAGLNPRASRKGAGRSAFGAFFGDTMNTIGKMSVNANRMNQNALLGIPRTNNPNQPFYDPFAHFLPNYKHPSAKPKHKHHKSKTRTIVLKI